VRRGIAAPRLVEGNPNAISMGAWAFADLDIAARAAAPARKPLLDGKLTDMILTYGHHYLNCGSYKRICILAVKRS
jgi:hypothetical protein